MVTNINGKKLIANFVIAIFCIGFFSGVLPFLTLLILDYIFNLFSSFRLPMSDSGLVIYELGEIWEVFGSVVIVQSISSIPAIISVCVVIGILTEKVKTNWVYPLGMFLSFAVFGVFLFISFVISSFIDDEAFVFFWYLFSFVIVIFFSVLLGLMLVAVNKRLSK